MHLILVTAAFILSQASSDLKTIRKGELPLSPLKLKQVIVGQGLDFSLAPAEDRNFDPNKEMPSTESSANGQTIIKWIATPANYIVTDDQMLSVIEPRKDDAIFHQLEIIQYREKKPWKLITHIYILLFDHKIFCIVEGDMENDSPEFSCDANLRMTGRIAPKLDVGQYESGTGAFNSHALFELAPTGPQLIEISKGGRDH